MGTDPFWKGPKPVPETILTVTLVGDSRKWRVVGRRALKSECSMDMEAGTDGCPATTIKMS